jgi:hypothetical protein
VILRLAAFRTPGRYPVAPDGVTLLPLTDFARWDRGKRQRMQDDGYVVVEQAEQLRPLLEHAEREVRAEAKAAERRAKREAAALAAWQWEQGGADRGEAARQAQAEQERREAGAREKQHERERQGAVRRQQETEGAALTERRQAFVAKWLEEHPDSPTRTSR